MRTADLLLHPVRLRIVQAFLGGRQLTTSQLAAALDDVPPASLYRHVAKLAQADILKVVAERQAHGATERTYALQTRATMIDPDELADMTSEDHRRGFLAFMAGMLSDFDAYASRPDGIDLQRDHVSYRMAAVWLTDEELQELAQDMGRVLAARLPIPPGSGRKPRILRTIWLPGAAPADESQARQSRASIRARL